MAIGSPSLTASPKAIKEAAFENSACPVIITLENYLSPDGQRLGTGDMEGWWQKGKGIRKDAGWNMRKEATHMSLLEHMVLHGTSKVDAWSLVSFSSLLHSDFRGISIFLDYIIQFPWIQDETLPMEAQQWFYSSALPKCWIPYTILGMHKKNSLAT